MITNNTIDAAIINAFTATSVELTDKAERTVQAWVAAMAAGSIMAQSVAQLKLEGLVGSEQAIALLTAVGENL